MTVGFEEDAYQIVSIEELFIMVRSLSTNGLLELNGQNCSDQDFFFFFLYCTEMHNTLIGTTGWII